MAQLAYSDDRLTVQLTGARRLLGRYRPLAIDWRHVANADHGTQTAGGYPGARWGVSTHIPGVVTAGSFRTMKTRDFWDVGRGAGTIVIELTGHKYDRLILQVDDPDAALAAIRRHAAVAPR